MITPAGVFSDAPAGIFVYNIGTQGWKCYETDSNCDYRR